MTVTHSDTNTIQLLLLKLTSLSLPLFMFCPQRTLPASCMSSVKLNLLSLTVGNNFDRLWGYQTLRPLLTKYCWGRWSLLSKELLLNFWDNTL